MKIIVQGNDKNHEVHLEDLGRGISGKDRVQIFNLVFTWKLPGTGLGLIYLPENGKKARRDH